MRNGYKGLQAPVAGKRMVIAVLGNEADELRKLVSSSE